MKKIWEINQYPRLWVGNIVKNTIKQLRMKEQRKGYKAGVAVKQEKNTEKHQIALQYRGNNSNEFVKKVNKIHSLQKIFTTRKLRSCLLSLKSSFDKDLKSHVVYELTCNGCKSIYIGQTCRLFTTRVAEHAQADSPMEIHAMKRNGEKTAFPRKILDQCGNQSKLLTLEALFIRTVQPAINTREEYRTQELTLKA